MSEQLLTADDVATLLQISVHTLASWRRAKKEEGPPWVMVGGMVRYRSEDVQKWLDSRTQGAPLA